MKRRPGALSPDGNGAVGKPAVSSPAQIESGDLERRRQQLEALYQANMQVAENLKRQERLVADLDDNELSGCLWALQMAVLGFDRELRRRR